METPWSLQGDREPELAMFINQARSQVEGLGKQPSHKNLTYSLSCLQSVLGPEHSRIDIKEMRAFIQKMMAADGEFYRQPLR